MKHTRIVIGPQAHEPRPDEHDHEPSVVYGSNKDDILVAGGGPQIIHGFMGNDIVRAGGGPDVVFGGNGEDILLGEGGPDQLHGGNGKDWLEGGCGPDSLYGGNGKDVLIGGDGRDVLTGGEGADVFLYTSADEAPGGTGHEGEDDDHGDDHGGGHDEGHDGGGCSGGGPETITDFEVGLDLIDLSAIGSVTGFADGPQAWSVWAEQDGEDTILRIDTDGDLSGEHPQEMTIVLSGIDAETLGASDFLF